MIVNRVKRGRVTCEQDSISREWLVKRGNTVIERGLTHKHATELVHTLQQNDAWLERANVNEYYRQSRGY